MEDKREYTRKELDYARLTNDIHEYMKSSVESEESYSRYKTWGMIGLVALLPPIVGLVVVLSLMIAELHGEGFRINDYIYDVKVKEEVKE